MSALFPAKLPDRPQKTSKLGLTKRLTQKLTPQLIKPKQVRGISAPLVSKIIDHRKTTSPAFSAADPYVASHVFTRQTTSPPLPVLVKGSREAHRRLHEEKLRTSAFPPTKSPQKRKTATLRKENHSKDRFQQPFVATQPARVKRKDIPRPATQSMVQDPLVERFHKLRLPDEREEARPLAPAALPPPRSPTNFSLPFPPYDSTTASKLSWYSMAVSNPVLPTLNEHMHSRVGRHPPQQSIPHTTTITIDTDSEDEGSMVSNRRATNFSNVDFFQSGRGNTTHSRRSRIGQFLPKKAIRRSRSPSESDSDTGGGLTPGSSEDSNLDLTARTAHSGGRDSTSARIGTPTPHPVSPYSHLQEEQDLQLAQRLQQEADEEFETARSLYFEQLQSMARPASSTTSSSKPTPRAPKRKTTPITSLKRAIARSGTREDPISLDSDSDLDEHDTQNKTDLLADPMDLDDVPDHEQRTTKVPRTSYVLEKPERIELPWSRDCVVCGDSVRISDLPSLPNCIHPPATCSDCYSGWITAQLQGSSWSEVKCPGDGCKISMSYHEIQQHATTQTFQQYDTYIARAAISKDPNFRWCRACDSGQIHLSGVEGNIFRCIACGHKVCIIHEATWHEGETCEEFDYRSSGRKERDQKAQEEASVKTIGKLAKKCPGPGCVYNIEKNDGCDHMTCSSCRYEFCWCCLCDYNSIRARGNSAHATDCKYHTARLE